MAIVGFSGFKKKHNIVKLFISQVVKYAFSMVKQCECGI